MTTGRRTSRSIISLGLAVALALPVFAPVSAIAAGDDDIPGVGITASPVVGALDATGTAGPVDADDVYAVELRVGESFSATLTGDPGTDFDALLWGPDALSIVGPFEPVAEAPLGTYPETINYTVKTTGTHYFDVQAFTGVGGYSAEWSTATVEVELPSDDNISGAVRLTADSAVGTVNDLTDNDDVYKVYLEQGDQIDVSLDWTDPDASLEAFVFGPGATTVDSDPLARSAPGDKPAVLSHVAETTGDYYFDVYALFGSSAYTLSYTITTATPPDGNDDISVADTATTSPLQGYLRPVTDDHDVYAISIFEGQQLTVSLTGMGTPAPEFFVDLYSPGAGSLASTLPVAPQNDESSFTYTAKETGVHYLDVSTVDSMGEYQVSWQLSQLPVDIQLSLPAHVAWQKAATLSARLTAVGGPVVGSVELQHRPYGQANFIKLADVQTGSDGRATYTVYPKSQTEYRLVFAETPLYVASESPIAMCTPYGSVSTPKTLRTTYAANAYFVASGTLKPRHLAGSRDMRIYADRYERLSNGTYKWVPRRAYATKLANFYSYSKYTAGIRLPYKGKWRLRAYVVGNGTHAATYSGPRYITVK